MSSNTHTHPCNGVPLWCKSNFSFLEGASHPEELVSEAHRLGHPALALTDRDGVYGAVRAHLKAKELGIKLIFGAQVTVEDGSILVLLAQNKQGYGNLCRLITGGRINAPKGTSAVSWSQICQYNRSMIALWGGDSSLIKDEPDETRLLSVAEQLCSAYGDRLYALIPRHRRDTEVQAEARVRQRAARFKIPCVAAVEVLYHHRDRRPLQDVLTCIRHGVPIHQAADRTKPNAEHDLKPPDEFGALFADDPEAVSRTLEIAERCTFNLAELRYRYPSERLPDGTTSSEYLRRLTFEGAARRYKGKVPFDVSAQVLKELDLIDELDYCGYFLTMYEIVRFCREKGILCQGRGSAANSAVCFCLGITAVDPVKMGLLFERFISRERAEPPDIDLDIAHERREEVIQHVYEKYGRSHAAMVAIFVRYRGRSAIREVGKVLGFSETLLDRLARLTGYWDAPDPEELAQADLDPARPLNHLFLKLVHEIQDFPRHLSIHPGGFLLGHEPVWNLVPVENATMPGRTVIQWDKYDVEALDLFKVDLLGLGALSLTDRCFKLIRAHRDKTLSMATLPADDPETYDMICRADTVGVFQIESRAQMAMLPRLRPRSYYDLVIEVSIVRPGPITGDMVHPYLRRRHGQEPVIYPHPCLEPVLKKTLGVPLFQEQVMRLAMEAADYTPGEADQLRRDMAAWRRSGSLDHHRDRLITRMKAKGIEEEFAERVFNQIRGFGEYGFPESHAASFALIGYATAFLKCHYPVEFTAALLNAQPLGFYTPATIIDDAKRHHVPFRPVDIMASEWDCTLEPNPDSASPFRFAIRMGFRYIKGLAENDVRRILENRAQAPFTSLDDLSRRARIDRKVMSRLARAGALRDLERLRRVAYWDAIAMAKPRTPTLPLPPAGAKPPFKELNLLETIHWDYGATGHSTAGHPLTVLRETLNRMGLPDARTVTALPDGKRVRYAGLVVCRQRPGTAKGVFFMTMEDETGFVNVVMWPKIYERNKVLAKTAYFLGVTGKIQKEDDVTHLVADTLWQPELDDTPQHNKSRDFR